LFPLLLEGKQSNSFIGITCGFVIGFAVINGLETIIEMVTDYFENSYDKKKNNIPNIITDDNIETENNVFNPIHDLHINPKHIYTRVTSDTGEELDPISFDLGYDKNIVVDIDMTHAENAISNPSHRSHILSHFDEIKSMIKGMETKSYNLLLQELNATETEKIAEEIDESIHSLQYKIDHCRRLLQGSEYTEALVNSNNNNIVDKKTTWVTEDKKVAINKRLTVLRCTMNHLVEHLNEEKITTDTLKEMITHMKDMDHNITIFHDTIDNISSFRWGRRVMPETVLGDKLPLSLIIPIAIDCFVDGFLIGVSVVLSPKAGYVLTLANTLEMSFLGMAYSSRLCKCTGSTPHARFIATLFPPLLMLLATGVGASLAKIAFNIPAVYIGFVAFGVIALLTLVCCELLIEARENQQNNEKWFIQGLIFVGVYLVLMLDNVI